MSVVVRFAPSPTGYLHIGGARTALFNWLYARHCGGKFLLRIEDTDRERSTKEAIDANFESLQWLGLNWDAPPVFQFARAPRHAEVAKQLVEEGKAYYCYCSVEDLETMRKDALSKGESPRYNGYWRNRPLSEAPAGVKPVVRFKAPQVGKTVLVDDVQGTVEMDNAQLDDMVLLRADGTPTYMLSVVVDDHDMDITHIIRGDDHLTNAFRQFHLYKACGWDVPHFAHIPLIHGPDGAKLSKRHGALGAEHYKKMGFFPEAMRNYLLRLGWAHGNDEMISTEQAIQWFDTVDIGRSPARFDLVKLTHLNGMYMRLKDNRSLLEDLRPFLASLGQDEDSPDFDKGLMRVQCALNGLKERAKTLEELAKNALFLMKKPQLSKEEPLQTFSQAGEEKKKQALLFLQKFSNVLKNFEILDPKNMEVALRSFCEDQSLKLGDFLYPVRLALTGTTISPSLFELFPILGQDEIQERLAAYIYFLNDEK